VPATLADVAPTQVSRPERGDSLLQNRRFQLAAGFILLFNAVFVLIILVRPFAYHTVALFDNVGEFLGPLLIAPLCFARIRTAVRPAPEESPSQRLQAIGAVLIGGGILGFVGGQVITTVYQWVLNVEIPVPSSADAFFLAAYPLMFAGVLLLPAQRIPASQRTRVLLDGVMILAAAFSFLWYIDLGQTLAEGSAGLLTRVVASAYPAGDLILVVCLILLASRAHDQALRRALPIFAVGIACLVYVDSDYAYQNLPQVGTYVTGGLKDDLWPLGYMLLGLGAWMVITARPQAEEHEEDVLERAAHARRTPLWRSLLPYTLVPCVMGLAAYTLIQHVRVYIVDGVVAGAGVLLLATLVRQILSMLEAERLSAQQEDYLREVRTVILAAGAVEAGTFEPESMSAIAQRQDALGQLGRVFQHMGREVKAREQRLQQQMRELKIEIDRAKREREVKQIVETDYFQDLQRKAEQFRREKAERG
jgi:hypothetical protein